MTIPEISAAPKNQTSGAATSTEHSMPAPRTPPHVLDQLSSQKSFDFVDDCWKPFTNFLAFIFQPIIGFFECLFALVCHLFEKIFSSTPTPEVMPTVKAYQNASIQLLTFISHWSDTMAGGSVWNSLSGIPWDSRVHGTQFLAEFHALPNDAQIKIRTYLYKDFTSAIEQLRSEVLQARQVRADLSPLSPEESLKLACNLYLQRNAPSDALIDVIREQQRVTHRLFREALRSIPPAELLRNSDHPE